MLQPLQLNYHRYYYYYYTRTTITTSTTIKNFKSTYLAVYSVIITPIIVVLALFRTETTYLKVLPFRHYNALYVTKSVSSLVTQQIQQLG